MDDVQGHLCFILDEARDGIANMAIDESLFRRLIQEKSAFAYLRFYHFSEPTFTIGYGLWSKAERERSADVPAVRRLTGGGIVFHRSTDLTYSFIVPLNLCPSLKKVRESYFLIHEELRQALSEFGVAAELFHQGSTVKVSRASQLSQASAYCFESPVP